MARRWTGSTGGALGHPARAAALGAPPEQALAPLRDPAWCMREACKHLGLLEDHLRVQDRRCADCIGKHALLVEGFSEEAAGFCGPGAARQACLDLAAAVRDVWVYLRAPGADAEIACEQVRRLRKAVYEGLPR